MKEKVDCGNLPQLADFARLATPLARFDKVDRTATNQKVGSSNPPGRTTLFKRLQLSQTSEICGMSVNCPCSVHPGRNQGALILREIEIAFVSLGNLVDEKGFEPSASSLRGLDMHSGEIATDWAIRSLKERALTLHSRAFGRQRGNIGRNLPRIEPCAFQSIGMLTSRSACFRSLPFGLRPFR